MEIVIDDNAIKDLAKITKKDAERILAKLEILSGFPDIPNIKKLTHFDPPYRLRVGNYRVLFDVKDGIVTVYNVKHRKESYR